MEDKKAKIKKRLIKSKSCLYKRKKNFVINEKNPFILRFIQEIEFEKRKSNFFK